MDNYNPNRFRYKYNLLDPPILDAQALLENIGIPDNAVLHPRHMYLKIGSSSNSKGSAYMEYGNTKVMVHVDKPKEITAPNGISDVMGTINCLVKYSPLIYDDADVILQKEEHMNFVLRNTLESVVCLQEFINLQLDINVIILDDDGCALSTAINCCGMALISGGIPLYDLIVSSTVCYLNKTEYINPSADVEQAVSVSAKIDNDDDDEDCINEHGSVTLSTIFTYNQVTQLSQKGFMSMSTLERLCDYAISVNRQLQSILRQALSRKVDLEVELERYKLDNSVDNGGDTTDSK